MCVSALILTLNEEANLAKCLDSLSWCDDVVVLDSYSSDGTERIADEKGARFVQRKFDDYATQRTYGLQKISYKHPWVLMVDADEEITTELREEMDGVLAAGTGGTTMYRIRRKDFFMGKWIKHSSGYPTWFARLLKIGHVHCERSINEHCETAGEIGYLKQHFLHYPFNKGMAAWLEKHNRYSTMEAELMVQGGKQQSKDVSIFSSDPMLRRKAIKALVYRLPCRPTLVFLALYILRLGFLDGMAGLRFCQLRKTYEFMIDCKVKELRRRAQGLNI